MLEQNAGDVLELARVLSQHRVFELHHIDALRENLPMDQPRQIRDAKFANRVRFDGAHQLRHAQRPNHKVSGCANAVEFCMRGDLARRVEEHHQVEFAPSRQFLNCLVHEHAAAMNGWANRIRRNKQHAQRPTVGTGIVG